MAQWAFIGNKIYKSVKAQIGEETAEKLMRHCAEAVFKSEKEILGEALEILKRKQEKKARNLTMNKVILLGNLTRDPEIRYSQGEKQMAVARFSLAVNRRFAKDGETSADFLNCTAFGKTAEFVEKYFRQGSRMSLVGRIENNNYTNKNGEKVYSVQIMVEEVEFAERKSAQSNNQTQNQNQPAQANGADDDFMNIPDGIEDGLPFN